MVMGDKDCVSRVLSLADEEPLGVVKMGVNVVWEVIRQYCCNGSNSMVGKGKTSLCRSGGRSVG